MVDREGSQDVQGIYAGRSLSAAVTPCGTNWTTLDTTVTLPPANSTVNGTALQLQIVAPPSKRDWGATVWIGSASIVEAVL